MSHDGEFDFDLWLAGTQISDAGLKKLKAQAVVDEKSLYLMTRNDVLSMKLAAADRAKYFDALSTLDPVPNAALVKSPTPSSASDQSSDSPDIPPGSPPPDQGTLNANGIVLMEFGAKTHRDAIFIKSAIDAW